MKRKVNHVIIGSLYSLMGNDMTTIAGTSPVQLLQSQLASGVTSGAIKSSDQDALSSAITDIDSSLKASGLNGTAPSKSTIDSLIAKQVESGKLSADQANELQDVFGSFAAQGGGPPGNSDSSSSGALVDEFLKTLKEASTTVYNAAGTSSASISALLVNIRT
jgi:hypothetical protein